MFVLALPRSTLDADAQERVRQTLEERRLILADAQRQEAQLAEAQRSSLQRRIDETKREQSQLAAEVALHRQRLALVMQALSAHPASAEELAEIQQLIADYKERATP